MTFLPGSAHSWEELRASTLCVQETPAGLELDRLALLRAPTMPE